MSEGHWKPKATPPAAFTPGHRAPRPKTLHTQRTDMTEVNARSYEDSAKMAKTSKQHLSTEYPKTANNPTANRAHDQVMSDDQSFQDRTAAYRAAQARAGANRQDRQVERLERRQQKITPPKNRDKKSSKPQAK